MFLWVLLLELTRYSTTCNPQTGVWSFCCPRCWFWRVAFSYELCRIHSNSHHPEPPQSTHRSLGWLAVDFLVSISLFSRKFGQYWILNWILQDNYFDQFTPLHITNMWKKLFRSDFLTYIYLEIGMSLYPHPCQWLWHSSRCDPNRSCLVLCFHCCS